ncbi:MAG: CGNR zinc finger domain-containing protein [candidate division Zixibacteria bacterium]|nr:CGNR zinc finger domain-containing protein [candidate division Zixibacteria bacterium]
MVDSWLNLLNSDWHDHTGSGKREDRLGNPARLDRYLSQLGYHPTGSQKGEIQEALRELRTLLRTIIDHIVADKTIPRSLWDRLNGFLASSPFIRQMEFAGGNYSIKPVALKNDVTALIARIAADFCQTLAEGEPARIKICGNKDCRWVFYDRSKNRSRRWCEGDTGCGSLMKVRRFRAKTRLMRTKKKLI